MVKTRRVPTSSSTKAELSSAVARGTECSSSVLASEWNPNEHSAYSNAKHHRVASHPHAPSGTHRSQPTEPTQNEWNAFLDADSSLSQSPVPPTTPPEQVQAPKVQNPAALLAPKAYFGGEFFDRYLRVPNAWERDEVRVSRWELQRRDRRRAVAKVKNKIHYDRVGPATGTNPWDALPVQPSDAHHGKSTVVPPQDVDIPHSTSIQDGVDVDPVVSPSGRYGVAMVSQAKLATGFDSDLVLPTAQPVPQPTLPQPILPQATPNLESDLKVPFATSSLPYR